MKEIIDKLKIKVNEIKIGHIELNFTNDSKIK